ncbi:MAG TPA: lipoprotein insertase outer membrane protein LolB [Povalibacter sp.]|jgi:outer membrane lipoprotein LolB
MKSSLKNLPTPGRWPFRVAMLATVTLLAACASQPVQPPASPLPSDLSELAQWHARGRIGVTGGQSGGSGSFEWQQSGDRADVQIRGPVGIGSVQLEMQGSAENPDLRLRTADGTTLESQAAWDELEARLGAPVPAGKLRYWMLGVAAPGEHQWHPANVQGVTTLEQSGWRIEYQQYSDDAGAHVPVKMQAASGDARVRIVVDRWQLGR